MREWLTVIIVLLIIGIVLDGVRRMRQSRRDSVRMARGGLSGSSRSAEQDDFTSELPNGGARVVAYREAPEVTLKPRPITAVEQDQDTLDEDLEASVDDDEAIDSDETSPADSGVDEAPVEEAPEPEAPAPATRYMPEQGSLNLDEAVPLLMESVEDAAQKADSTPKSVPPAAAKRPTPEAPSRKPETLDERKRIEPSFSAFDADEEDDLDAPVAQAPEKHDERDEPFAAASAAASAAAAKAKSVFSAGAKALAAKAPRSKPPETRAPAPTPPPQKAPAATKPSSSAPTPPDPEEVLVINIMAPEGERFLGPALLDALLASGLRFGSMAIFHRHSDEKGKGPILFSLANMVKPGVFDLETMDEFSTPGVSLFMTLPLEIEGSSIKVFDLMADAARDISNALGGELKDENRSIMTRQTLEHCRQRVAEFERKQLSRPHH
ncbi:cell division protein ZipA [Marinimicrobium alkaliphilum]|uniref:cell division protein ZipA n=1 Tax=Marinimicrobium alkaliphilum TaxID=2202654 RepID=UPI001E284F69|nr:cell division protein ZipA [Marinimicrobium alkaliphilum]